MDNGKRIEGFVAGVFAGNTANNYLSECNRWSNERISNVSVGLEPGFEVFDASQTYLRITGKEKFFEPLFCSGEWFVKLVKVPIFEKIDWARFESLLSRLSGFGSVVSFEVFFRKGEVQFFVGCGSVDALDSLCNVFNSFFCDAVFVDVVDPFVSLSDVEGELSLFDLSCGSPYYREVSCDRVVGCFSGLFRVFSGLRSGECGFYQCLFVPVKHKWGLNVKSLLASEKLLGSRCPFGVSSSGSVKDVARPLFACGVRFGCVSKNNSQVRNGLSGFAGSFIHDGKPLRFRDEKDYFRVIGKKKIARMIADRLAYSSGLLLSSVELSGFVHFPSVEASCPSVRLDSAKGFKVPESLKSGRPLGINRYTGKEEVVCLPGSERNKSVWSLGAPRMGKSVSLNNQFLWVAGKGDGACFIDPHRRSAFELIGLLPESCLERVVFLDYDDKTHVIDSNFFDEDDVEAFGRLSVEMANSLKHLFEAVSFHRMSHILRMCVYALFVLKKNLSSIPVLLSGGAEGERLRQEVFKKCRNDEVRRFWKHEFRSYPKEAFNPVINRFSALFMDDRALRIFSREKNKVNISHIMDNGGLLIVALPSSVDVSNIVGGFFIAKFQKCAFARM